MRRISFISTTSEAFLRGIYKKSKKSYSALADICGVNRRTFYDWRSGKHLLPEIALNKLCRLVNIKPPKVKRLSQYWYAHGGIHKRDLVRYQKYSKILEWKVESSVRGARHAMRTHRRHKTGLFPTIALTVTKDKMKLAEFIGIVLGDGGVSSNQITISLHRKDDKEYTKYVDELIYYLFGFRPSTLN